MVYLMYILTVVGIGYFITLSELFKPIRVGVSALNEKNIKFIGWFIDKIDGVLNCIYCASFWIGIIVSFLLYEEFDMYTVFYGFSCMGFIYVVKNLFPKK